VSFHETSRISRRRVLLKTRLSAHKTTAEFCNLMIGQRKFGVWIERG